MERGWIFTVGELVAATLYVSGFTDCTSIYSGTSYIYGKNLTTTGSIGGVALLGLRIWEIIDLWAAPPSQNAEYRRVKEMNEGRPLSFFAIPSPRSGDGLASVELGLHYQF